MALELADAFSVEACRRRDSALNRCVHSFDCGFGLSERQRYCGENTFGAMPTGSGSVSVRLRVMAASFCDNMGDVSLWGECFSQ